MAAQEPKRHKSSTTQLADAILTLLLGLQGMDISPAMLDVAKDREADGDLCLGDLGHGLPFRAGMFDGAISISAVQWLCNAVRPLPCVGMPVLSAALQVTALSMLCLRAKLSAVEGCQATCGLQLLFSFTVAPVTAAGWAACAAQQHASVWLTASACWLVQDTKGADVRARLKRFFSTLYACLARGARAVLQIYPESTEQVRCYPDHPNHV